MQNQWIQLIPAEVSLAEQVVDYYQRNRKFLEKFEPVRTEDFFSLAYQREVLQKEIADRKEKTAFRFYIKLVEQPEKIIGMIGLNNVVWGGYLLRIFGIQIRRTVYQPGVHVNGRLYDYPICF